MEKECCKDCLDREVLPINSKLIPRERCGNSNCRCHSLPQKDKNRCEVCDLFECTCFCKCGLPHDQCVCGWKEEDFKLSQPNEQWEKDLEFILTEWEGKSNPLMGALRVVERKKRLSAFISKVVASARSQERQLLREKIEGMVWPNVQKGEKFESGYNSALSDLLDYLNTEQ